jgi:predicted glycoside hydrolase/deacetylase ChbG (UPF0249 family)
MTTESRALSLVVTADDFGIGVQTSRGIIQAHLKGPVTATSVMVITGKHVEESIPLLAEAPNLDVGLHLVLTRCGHRPLVAKQSSGLTDREGEFLTNRKLWGRAMLGRIHSAAVAEEIVAQAELFEKLVGKRPAFVDGHHHAHQLPGIRQALVGVTRTIRILPPVSRVTVEPPEIWKNVGGARLRRRAANYVGKRAAAAFSAGKVRANDFYFGMLSEDDVKKAFPWEGYLANLPKEGVVEWVVHPGMSDPTLPLRDGYQIERTLELEALTGMAGAEHLERVRPFLARKSHLGKSELGKSALAAKSSGGVEQ